MTEQEEETAADAFFELRATRRESAATSRGGRPMQLFYTCDLFLQSTLDLALYLSLHSDMGLSSRLQVRVGSFYQTVIILMDYEGGCIRVG